MTAIERLRRPGRRAARMGTAMARAFKQEPNFRYMLTNEARRERALAWFFGSFLVRLGLTYGEVYAEADGSGGAVWMRPGASVSTWGSLRAGLLAMPLHLGLRGTARSAAFGAYIEDVREKVAPPDHWYLVALGVEPDRQGRGFGAALMQPVLERADDAASPSYLETFRERTVRFYERFGFEAIHEDAIPEGGPSFWCMARHPGG